MTPIEEATLLINEFDPANSDWNFRKGVILDLLRKATGPTELETPRMLVLSTAHIKQQTAELMDRLAGTSDRIDAGLPVYFAKGEYGWIIPIIDNPAETCPDGCPGDLKGVIEFAHANGCTWVMLDQDADVIDGLPSWDW